MSEEHERDPDRHERLRSLLDESARSEREARAAEDSSMNGLNPTKPNTSSRASRTVFRCKSNDPSIT